MTIIYLEVIKIINNVCVLDQKIKYILKYEYKFFLDKVNVVGVALGYKRKNNFYTSQKCIQVFVKRKLSKFELPENELVPYNYKGIPTDVIQSGVFTAHSLNKRIRPVLGGYSISTYNNQVYGSAGCLVTNGVLNFVLSTNHVMANENLAPLGSPIIQPAKQYGGFHPNDTIGTLHKFIPLRFIQGQSRPINLSDCAISVLSEPNIVSPKIAYIENLKGVKSPILNEEVRKVGATTELTTGIITDINAVSIVDFSSGRSCLLQNLIITNNVSQKGDSGSILVNKHNYALGIDCAGTDNISVFCSLKIVLDQLDVRLVT